MKEPDFLNVNCLCGVKEGELHELGCDMEICPFCSEQLISCGCCYIKLGFNYDSGFDGNFKSKTLFDGLPRDIYENGLTSKLYNKWIKILNKRGRIPYIIIPNFCRRCLKPYPEMFNVPDNEWEVVPKKLRKEILCKSCFNKIKKWIKRKNEQEENNE